MYIALLKVPTGIAVPEVNNRAVLSARGIEFHHVGEFSLKNCEVDDRYKECLALCDLMAHSIYHDTIAEYPTGDLPP